MLLAMDDHVVRRGRKGALTGSRNADLVATNKNDRLTREKLSGHDTAQSSEQVAAPVDDLGWSQHHVVEIASAVECWHRPARVVFFVRWAASCISNAVSLH